MFFLIKSIFTFYSNNKFSWFYSFRVGIQFSLQSSFVEHNVQPFFSFRYFHQKASFPVFHKCFFNSFWNFLSWKNHFTVFYDLIIILSINTCMIWIHVVMRGQSFVLHVYSKISWFWWETNKMKKLKWTKNRALKLCSEWQCSKLCFQFWCTRKKSFHNCETICLMSHEKPKSGKILFSRFQIAAKPTSVFSGFMAFCTRILSFFIFVTNKFVASLVSTARKWGKYGFYVSSTVWWFSFVLYGTKRIKKHKMQFQLVVFNTRSYINCYFLFYCLL